MTEKDGKEIVRSKKIRLFLVYVLFVFINMSVNRLVKALGLPLYVDNIGTLLGAVLGGYLPGIFVGYITNIINATADVANMYYAGVSVLIAVTATFFAKKGFYEKLWKALLTVPFLAFFGGCVGSVLTWFIYGSDTTFLRQLLYDFEIDLIDKTITVLGFYLINMFLPKSVSTLLELNDWRQKPLTPEEIKAAKKTETRSHRLRSKTTFLICLVMILVTLTTTTICAFLYRDFATERFKEVGNNVAGTVGLTVDIDKVDDYLNGEIDDSYAVTKKKLYDLRDSAEYMEHLYVYKIMEDGCHVVFDVRSKEEAGVKPGTVISFDELPGDLKADLMAGNAVDPVITNDINGRILTKFVPVTDKAGNIVCYAGADINMLSVRRNVISFLAKILSLFIGFFIMIAVLCLWLTDYHLTYPIDSMTTASKEFEHGSRDEMDAGVKNLESLNISTADEIENLYDTLIKTLSETVGYLEDVQHKSEQIEYMQNGLIYILADLVESRDKNTGDHVRKTAAYVRLMLGLLKENNEFPDELTDEYIKNVINAAPLHDVGKIKVPDAILNKPGKLTDEEFVEMKKHTTAGKIIIENAMELTGETGYLKEARNLATYHHEKWNGMGYPEGLKETEIPLSARIMAVSDVFDALVSARSYKEPFSFDKAMDIIREGIGTHFDPVISKLFVENEDKVRQIAEANAKALEEDALTWERQLG